MRDLSSPPRIEPTHPEVETESITGPPGKSKTLILNFFHLLAEIRLSIETSCNKLVDYNENQFV